MIEPFDPATYPGPRAEGPVLVHDGRTYDVSLVEGDGVAVPAADVAAPVLEPGAVRWVVAYGSNACPGRLRSKGLDRRGAVVLPAELPGWVPAFEGRRTGYGAVPLTLVPAGRARTATWVLGVHVDDTPALDRSEGRLATDRSERTTRDDLLHAPAGAYRLGHVGDVTVAGRWHLHDALAYLPGPTTRVQVTEDGAWRCWPTTGQRAAAAHVDAAGPTAPAPSVPAVVQGPWPGTPLTPRR